MFSETLLGENSVNPRSRLKKYHRVVVNVFIRLLSHFWVLIIWKVSKRRESTRTILRPFSKRNKFTLGISSRILKFEVSSQLLIRVKKEKPNPKVNWPVSLGPTLKKLPLLSRGRRAEVLGDAPKAVLCPRTPETSQLWCVFIPDNAGKAGALRVRNTPRLKRSQSKVLAWPKPELQCFRDSLSHFALLLILSSPSCQLPDQFPARVIFIFWSGFLCTTVWRHASMCVCLSFHSFCLFSSPAGKFNKTLQPLKRKDPLCAKGLRPWQQCDAPNETKSLIGLVLPPENTSCACKLHFFYYCKCKHCIKTPLSLPLCVCVCVCQAPN